MTFKVDSNPNNLIPFASPINQDTAPNVAIAVDQIRARVLETIRAGMPITTLFNHELKIDLSHFVKDQLLFRRLAEFITPLYGREGLNLAAVAMHFENSELMHEIKAMFREPEPYLHLLYQACFDVLAGNAPLFTLEDSLEGRIFTLKNALIAQHTPLAIQNSQVQNKIPKQNLKLIQAAGATFIRLTLSMHLKALKHSEEVPFRQELLATAKQLIPFIKTVTKTYLEENDRPISDNPLTFRNPSGYNEHSIAAATVMEACLNALGYATRLLCRSDLEPRVSMATTHAVVEIMGPDNMKYLMDPCYVQFHNDISLVDQDPAEPLLLLAEDEVDGYIDSEIMPIWLSNYQRVKDNDNQFIQTLYSVDKAISYLLHTLGLPAIGVPLEEPAVWVKNAFRRIWGVSTYTPVFSNYGFQDIFCGNGDKKATYNMVKAMNIASLTHHLSFEIVKDKLRELSKDPSQHGMNSIEALSLIAKLPRRLRTPFEALLDVDTHVTKEATMDISLFAYFRALRNCVNPDGLDLKVVYGCSGADCLTVLLATDAQEITMVDLTKVTFAEFDSMLQKFRERDGSFLKETIDELEKNDRFITYRSIYSGSESHYREGCGHFMRRLPEKVIINLRCIGVDYEHIELTEIPDGIQLNFLWQYQEGAPARMRTIRYISSDITDPARYAPSLMKTIQAGFDIFYMKGSYVAARSFPQFLPHLAPFINTGGWLMMSEYTFAMETFDPEPALLACGQNFKQIKTEGIQNIENILPLPIDPFSKIPILQLCSDKQSRPKRTTGTDLKYWALLTLRQKV